MYYDGLNLVQELNSNGAVIATMLTGLNIDEYFEWAEPACCGPPSYLTDTTIGNLTYGEACPERSRRDPDGRRSWVDGSLAVVAIPRTASGNHFNADNEMTTFNGYPLTYDSDDQTLTDTSNAYTWDTRRHVTNSQLTGIGYGQAFVYDARGRASAAVCAPARR